MIIPKEVADLLSKYNALDTMISNARLRVDVSDREYNACEAASDEMKAIEEELNARGYSLTHVPAEKTHILTEQTEPSWTAHDDPHKPDYINLDYDPL